MDLDIYYDGQCPFCTNFVTLARLKKSYTVSLYDLREEKEKSALFTSQGYDINDGMVVILDKKIYHGYEAVYLIAALSNKNKRVGKIYSFFLSKKGLTKFLYPFMRAGRNFTLFLLGRKKI